MNTLELGDFDEHATGLDVIHRIYPVCIVCIDFRVEVRYRTVIKPPACSPTSSTAVVIINDIVVVAVWSAELHPVGVPVCVLCPRHRISGVSAVPGHRQPVLAGLVTDGECRVFSPVPLTVSTLNLQTET